MDPRHPEQAVDKMTELMIRFMKILDNISNSATSAKLGQLEREGGLVVQEICLVAPRLHEAMMQASRNRRHNLTHIVTESPVENYVEPNQAETVIVEPKPRKKKKTTRKKKAE